MLKKAAQNKKMQLKCLKMKKIMMTFEAGFLSYYRNQ
jgi:hypothetical protein